jgi:deuterolysin
MKLSTIFFLAGYGCVISAHALPPKLERRTSGLDIKIDVVDNTMVKAAITNTGSSTLRLLNEGTILDSAPVRKMRVSSPSKFELGFLETQKVARGPLDDGI